MPSLVTDNFRVFAAEQFIESLEEPYNSSDQPEADSSSAAQNYRSKIYLFTGRSQQWTLERYDGQTGVSEFEPPDQYDSFNDMNEIYDDMISVKRVTRSDLSKVIRRNTWTTGVKYDMYKNDYTNLNQSINGHQKLYDAQFYVINKNFNVYKCIYNGESATYPNGVTSTLEPTSTSTQIETLSDGYRWKYMYTITIPEYIKFVSTDFIPVKDDTDVKNAAIDGSIEQLIVDNRGSGIAANTYYVPIVGDNDYGTETNRAIAQIIVPSTGTNANKIDTATMQIVGTGYTRAKLVLTEGYTTIANAKSRSGTTTDLSSATVEAIISPPGGHGSDAALELGGYRVMINKSLDFLDGDGDIPVDSQFRRFGLIADPQNTSNTDLTANTATACYAIKFPSSTTDNFEPGNIITQSTTEAKGRVIHWDSVTKVLRYYQNEFIDEDQASPNADQLVLFSGANSITATTSQGSVTMTPDTGTSGDYFGVTFTNGYSTPEIKKNSGNIIYVENRKAVNRSNDQIEDIKLVIEF
jgi:hypothetical protein